MFELPGMNKYGGISWAILALATFSLYFISEEVDPCLERVFTNMTGRIRLLHTSKFVLLNAPNASASGIIAKFPTSKGGHKRDYEYELMASALDSVLQLGVRPEVRPYLALGANTSVAMASLAKGKGLAAIKSLEDTCFNEYINNQNVPVIAMNKLNGLKSMAYNTRKGFKMHVSNASLESVAYVHLLYELLGAHDDRDSKNCFIDNRGKFWALDIGWVRFTPMFSTKRTVLKCLRIVSHLPYDEIKCTAWHTLARKFKGLNWKVVEEDFHRFFAGRSLPSVARMQEGKREKECLDTFRLPGALNRTITGCYMKKDECVHGPLPNEAVRIIPLEQSRQTACIIDSSAVWAKVVRVRLSEYATELEKRLSSC